MELHTLKGNASSFGLNDVCAVIHAIEDEESLKISHLEQIEAAFRCFLDGNFEFLKVRFAAEQDESLLVSRSALIELRGQADSCGSREDLAKAVKAWFASVERVPAAAMLGPMAQYVERLAQ